MAALKHKNQQQQDSDFQLSPAQLKSLIERQDDFRNRVLLKVLYYCALRRMEAARLDVRDLDFNQATLTVRKGKRNKERVVPVDDHVLSDLKILTKGRTSGPVFLSNRKKAISVRMVNEVVKGAGIKAKIAHPDPRREHLNPHLLRHSFGRNSLHAGMPMNQVQAMLGHEKISTTIDIYGTPSIQQLHETMKRISGEI